MRTDERGGFVVDGDGERLVAVHPGHRRAVLEKPITGWPPFVVLQLGDEPLTIRGRVVDGDGNAVARAKVWVLDATLHERKPSCAQQEAPTVSDQSENRFRY